MQEGRGAGRAGRAGSECLSVQSSTPAPAKAATQAVSTIQERREKSTSAPTTATMVTGEPARLTALASWSPREVAWARNAASTR